MKTLDLERMKKAEYDENGRWADGPTETIPVMAVVQVARPQDMLRLPEAVRTTGGVLVFCESPLCVSSVKSNSKADTFDWHGDRYEIQSVEDWSDFGFFKAIATKVNR
jgi:hypothetical protein